MPDATVLTLLPSFHMVFTLLVIVGAMVAYASDKIPLEITSAVVISFLLGFFYFFPLVGGDGQVHLDMQRILDGFSNPALLAVISLLVVGQAMVQTGALNEVAGLILKISHNNAMIAMILTLLVVMLISAVLNNTPVVVIFIPIMAVMARHLDISASAVMMPLSFAAILGGMTTLLGSSTNLLVSGTLREMGIAPLSFFEFTLPGVILAGIGFLYILLIAPRLLPDRASLATTLVGEDERQFIAQIEVEPGSEFIGKTVKEGRVPDFKDIEIRMIQRGEHAFLPPFDEDILIRSADIMIVSATRKDLAGLLSKKPISLLQNVPGGGEVQEVTGDGELEPDVHLAEIIITPASRMIGRNLEQIAFHHTHNCVVLGIQRQSKIIRARVSELRLAAGDVLLVVGKNDDIMRLQENKDFLLLEWSTEEIHSGNMAPRAGIIFTGVVAIAAFDFIPITIAAFIGAVLVVITGCLNLRQAKRAIDSQIIFIIAASLSMGTALEETGAASYLAQNLVHLMHGASPAIMISGLFLLMMAVTNILSNNATAVLFTPIAVGVAEAMGVEPRLFVYAVIFASSCSFITPIGYQTNLLVMGPGHYKFSDFIRAGTPLAFLIWATFTAYAIWQFGL